MAQVAVIIGSDSDYENIKSCLDELLSLGIEYELRVLSAHRTPEELVRYVKNAEKRGIKLFIAGAGRSAHLPGVIAGYTTLPVIGVPLSGMLDGLDALLSIVQMPQGVPVATMAVGKAGAKNAAILAGEILAISNPELKNKLKQKKKELKQKVKQREKQLLNKISLKK